MTMQRMVVPVSWKAAKDCDDLPSEWKAAVDSDDEGGTNLLVGYASTFGNVDLGGDAVQPGAFTKTIDNIKANGIPLLADHMPMTASVLGTIQDARENSKGLLIFARLSKAPSAQDTAVKLREGHLSKLSIGYETMDESFEERDGRKVRLLNEVKLWETSVVVFPMNPEATIETVKSVLGMAAEAGQDPETLRREAESKDLFVGLIKRTDAAPEVDTLAVWKTQYAVETKTGVPSDQSGSVPAATPVGSDGGTTPASGGEPGQGSGEEPKGGWDPWVSEAMLHGRPTGEVDPVKRAGLTEALRLNEAALADTD